MMAEFERSENRKTGDCRVYGWEKPSQQHGIDTGSLKDSDERRAIGLRPGPTLDLFRRCIGSEDG